eukprot:70894_1
MFHVFLSIFVEFPYTSLAVPIMAVPTSTVSSSRNRSSLQIPSYQQPNISGKRLSITRNIALNRRENKRLSITRNMSSKHKGSQHKFLTRKQLNKKHAQDINKRPFPRSPIHLPLSTVASPPLSPNTRHNATESCLSDSDDTSSLYSHSNGTTGQQHKLADIALPSSYYHSEYGDVHNLSKPQTGGASLLNDDLVDGINNIPEYPFTEGNLELHNQELSKANKHTNYNNKHSNNIYITNIYNCNSPPPPQHAKLLSNLSGISTESQAMSILFHPTNRMQSMFQNKKNLSINPEFSTTATLDPLDELDDIDVLTHYHKHRELGNGTDAFVFEAVDRRDKAHVAMKLTKRKSGRYKTEIHLLHQLRTCPYVVKLLNCVENDNVYVLILEHAPMSLQYLLIERCTRHPMQERVAKSIVLHILKGIRAIHNLGFVHKDIKPHNILLFADQSERKVIAKVADFGFATRVALDAAISGNITLENLPREKYKEFEKHVRARCGTPGFWPPELVMKMASIQHAFKMDVFSAGVTLYRMLCNEMPFGIFDTWKCTVDQEGQKKLCKIKPNWQVICWLNTDNGHTPFLSSIKLSDTVKDILRSMLRIRPEVRADVDKCLKHPFFYKTRATPTGHTHRTNPDKSKSKSKSKSSSGNRDKSKSKSKSKSPSAPRKKRSGH